MKECPRSTSFYKSETCSRHVVPISYTKIQQNEKVNMGNLGAETRLHTLLEFFFLCFADRAFQYNLSN